MTKVCNGVIDKDYYRNLTLPKGFTWGGFDSDKQMHMFARKVLQSWQEVEDEPGTYKLVKDDERGRWRGLWENVLATEEDIKNGNAVWMMENGYTRL